MPVFAYRYFLALIPLLVAVDPLGSVPVYVAAAEQTPAGGRRRLYVRAVVAAAVIAVGFVFLGRAVFLFLGITVEDFQIAGGVLLVAIALYEITGAGSRATATVDPSIVPLAVPLTIGPAVMTVSLELVATRGPVVTCLALFSALGLLLVLLLLSDRLLRVVSMEALRAFAKIMYLLLAAIGVHYVRRGVGGQLG